MILLESVILDMNRYIALQKIVELGNFTKAAEALGYTQSAISQMVASLENELNIKLLSRSKMGAKLTIEGEDLYPFIERSIFQYQAMQEKANEINGIETGIIRVGTISSVTCHWLPQLIKGFTEKYPNVEFVFHQGDYTSIQEWIRIGTVDFGIVTPPAVRDMATKIIKDGEMLVILPENHPLAELDTIPLEKLADEPYILMEEGHYSEPLKAFESCGIKPNIKYTIHDDYAIMTMVEVGLGVSILAELVLRRTNYNIVMKPTNPPIKRTLAIGYKDKNSLPIASKYFIDYMIENADMLP